MTKEKNVYLHEDLQALLNKKRNVAHVQCVLETPLIGGVPAGEKELKAFVQYQLGLDPESDEGKQALARIKREEIKDTTPPEGELKTEEVYGYCVIRHSKRGPYIAEHQIKAALKQSASRLGIFQTKRGTKGDLAEMGSVVAAGRSLVGNAWEVNIFERLDSYSKTYIEVLRGTVSGPQGKRSIQVHHQAVAAGAMFDFDFLWPEGKLKKADVAAILAGFQQIGIGSALSLGYGKVKVELEFA